MQCPLPHPSIIFEHMARLVQCVFDGVLELNQAAKEHGGWTVSLLPFTSAGAKPLFFCWHSWLPQNKDYQPSDNCTLWGRLVLQMLPLLQAFVTWQVKVFLRQELQHLSTFACTLNTIWVPDMKRTEKSQNMAVTHRVAGKVSEGMDKVLSVFQRRKIWKDEERERGGGEREVNEF